MKFDSLQTVHYLKPAELCFAVEPVIIKTILGSCITVTMWCQRLGAAAACHALLPSCGQVSSCDALSCKLRNKYVDCVIPEMLKRFTRMGIDIRKIEVKLFGGADMFKANDKDRGRGRIGSMNIAMARKVLKKHGLRLNNLDVGGTRGRKIFFDTRTGEVWMKRLSPSQACLVAADDMAGADGLGTSKRDEHG